MKIKTQTLVSISKAICLSAMATGIFVYAYNFLELKYLKLLAFFPYAYFLLCVFDSMCQQEDRVEKGLNGYNPVEEFGIVIASVFLTILFSLIILFVVFASIESQKLVFFFGLLAYKFYFFIRFCFVKDPCIRKIMT